MNNADWWSKKLNNLPQQPQVTRPDPTPPMPPSQRPMAPMPAFQQPQTPVQAQSAFQNDSCPDCRSSNYFSVQNARPRCFDCGYPTEQSGSRYGSLAGASVDGPVKSSLGNDASGNWQGASAVQTSLPGQR
jgi:hypothetical protein